MHVIRRIVAPIMWVLCLVMFLLPWTSIRCDGGKEVAQLQSMSGAPGGSTTIVVAHQNGFQVLSGGHSMTKDGEMIARMDQGQPLKVSCGPAYPLWGMLLGVLACIIGSFALPTGTIRKYLLPAAAALALGCLALQSVIGLPARDKDFLDKLVPQGEAGAARANRGLFTVYSIGFYGAWSCVVLGSVFTCFELIGGGARPSTTRRPRASRSEDVEGEDDL